MAAWRSGGRRSRTPASPAADPFGDVFLVVDGWATLRGEYDDLEPLITDLATRGLSYGVHVVATRGALAGLPARRSGTCSAPGWSCASVTRPTRWWPGGRRRTCRSRRRAGDHRARACTSSPRCRSSPPGGDTADLVKAVRGRLGRAGRAPGAAAPAGAAVRRAGPRRRRPAWRSRSGSPRRTCARCCSTSPPSRTSWSSATPSAASRRSCARWPPRSSTRFTPEQARVILVDYRRSLLGTDRDRPPDRVRHRGGAHHRADRVGRRLHAAAGCPARRSPRRSCGTGPGGPGRSCSCWSTTTTWWPAVRRTRCGRWRSTCRRPATSVCTWCWPAARGGAGRAQYEPIVQRLRELSTAGLVMAGSPDEGQLVGAVRPGPLPAGRGRLVTRREGVRLVQLAHLPPP